MGLMHLKIKIKEKFKLKTKLTKTKVKNQFYISYAESFQLPNAVLIFKIHPLALEIQHLAQEIFSHFALKEKHKKTGEGLPCD